PASGIRWLLTDVLHDEWGFDGFVVSDCFSITEMITHGFAEDRRDAARISANAGLAMDMVTNAYMENLPSLVKNGEVPIEQIDSCVAGILRVKFSLGLFDDPYVHTPQSVKYHPDHLAAAREAALQSAVLLKNENGVLPIGNNVKRILLTGPLSDARYDQLGTWIFDGEKSHTVTLYDALKQECEARGIQLDFVPALKYTRHNNPEGIVEATEAARNADMIIAAVGEEAIFSGEGHCLTSLDLIGLQSELLDSLASTGKPMVTIVMAGRPLTIKQQLDQSQAMLYSFHPGTMGGAALADLLLGKASPSGRLPVSFPVVVGQIPLYYNHNNTGRPATGNEIGLDGIPEDAGNTFLGCTSYYLDAPYKPLFPFGYGLTYGKFNYSDLKLDADTYSADDIINVSFNLQNSGDYKATEVVQLYVRDHAASVTRPVRELKGFKRVSLAPGEQTSVTFSLPVSELAFIGRDMKPTVEPGRHTIYVGGDSEAPLAVEFTIQSTK
ncbi:MAG: glycoside hydrolase family 3 C-terminal domain-containing protein, partial [Muribaculum sp.]|nr:glycoside hydrolase family 3 C-terminal domain-containing protein [Muribaculum sp.]